MTNNDNSAGIEFAPLKPTLFHHFPTRILLSIEILFYERLFLGYKFERNAPFEIEIRNQMMRQIHPTDNWEMK